MSKLLKEEATLFENTFLYKAYGIVQGEGKEISIARQQDFQPLTYENVLAFLTQSNKRVIERIIEIIDKEKLNIYHDEMDGELIWNQALDKIKSLLLEDNKE